MHPPFRTKKLRRLVPPELLEFRAQPGAAWTVLEMGLETEAMGTSELLSLASLVLEDVSQARASGHSFDRDDFAIEEADSQRNAPQRVVASIATGKPSSTAPHHVAVFHNNSHDDAPVFAGDALPIPVVAWEDDSHIDFDHVHPGEIQYILTDHLESGESGGKGSHHQSWTKVAGGQLVYDIRIDISSLSQWMQSAMTYAIESWSGSSANFIYVTSNEDVMVTQQQTQECIDDKNVIAYVQTPSVGGVEAYYSDGHHWHRPTHQEFVFCENFTFGENYPDKNPFLTATHEIGHVLGIGHSVPGIDCDASQNTCYDVMAPYYLAGSTVPDANNLAYAMHLYPGEGVCGINASC